MTPAETDELLAINAEHRQRLAAWNAAGRPGPRPRKRFTAAQREHRRRYKRWYDSWCRPGDGPSPGHIRKRRSHA